MTSSYLFVSLSELSILGEIRSDSVLNENTELNEGRKREKKQRRGVTNKSYTVRN
jgi:hypothetical protein